MLSNSAPVISNAIFHQGFKEMLNICHTYRVKHIKICSLSEKELHEASYDFLNTSLENWLNVPNV